LRTEPNHSPALFDENMKSKRGNKGYTNQEDSLFNRSRQRALSNFFPGFL